MSEEKVGPLTEVMGSVLDECGGRVRDQMDALLALCRQAVYQFGQAATVTLRVRFVTKDDHVLTKITLTAQRPTADATEQIKFADGCDVVNGTPRPLTPEINGAGAVPAGLSC